MTEQAVKTPLKENEVWVAGVVNVIPGLSKEEARLQRYAFFEIDTTDENVFNFVLESYKKHDINLISQRIGQGYHFFGDLMPIESWKEWYLEVRELNKQYPPLTLR